MATPRDFLAIDGERHATDSAGCAGAVMGAAIEVEVEVEYLHRTSLDEDIRTKGRKKRNQGLGEMQADLDAYLVIYNSKQLHQGRGMNGKTPFTV